MATTKGKSKGIVSWPEEERPRERLLTRGPEALTDAELIGILVRVGYKGTSAVELGRILLKRFGSLRAMVEAPVIALLDVKGLKGAKAAQLTAAMEISRRVVVPTKRSHLQIKGTKAATDYLQGRLNGLSEEQFRVLFLNRRNALLDDTLIAQGAVDSVRPILRRIFARALQVNADALIAAHNYDKLPEEEKEKLRPLVAMIKYKRPPVANVDTFRAKDITTRVQKALGDPKVFRGGKQIDKFNLRWHTMCWRHFKVRPSGGSPTPEQTQTKYCIYDKRHDDYGYTEEWVRLLIEKFKDEKAYDEMFAKSPGAAS